MPLYKGSSKIQDFYIGSTKIGELYKGSTLVYTSTHYIIDEVVFESSTPGTYNIDLLDKGKYEIYCIGGGATSYGLLYHGSWYDSGGGSGAGFIGLINVNKGSHSIKIGNINENSYFDNVIVAGEGGVPTGWSTGGVGGVLTVNTTVISSILMTDGNAGRTNGGAGIAYGGESVFNSYGKGESRRGAYVYENATSGYVKIIYKGH